MTGIERPRRRTASTTYQDLGADLPGARMFQHRQWGALNNSSGVTQLIQETVAVGRWQA